MRISGPRRDRGQRGCHKGHSSGRVRRGRDSGRRRGRQGPLQERDSNLQGGYIGPMGAPKPALSLSPSLPPSLPPSLSLDHIRPLWRDERPKRHGILLRAQVRRNKELYRHLDSSLDPGVQLLRGQRGSAPGSRISSGCSSFPFFFYSARGHCLGSVEPGPHWRCFLHCQRGRFFL